MTKKLAKHVWPPRGQWNVKSRVLLAFGLLIAAKGLNATVPFILRDVIDFFNGKLPEQLTFGFATPSQAVISTGISLLIAYGMARAGTACFNEVELMGRGKQVLRSIHLQLRNALFARVAQRSIRDIARNIFLHLHNLDLSYHLNRQTGALSKAIDRGTRGMSTTLNSVFYRLRCLLIVSFSLKLVFNIIPTALEMVLVGAIFHTKCGPQFTWAMMACEWIEGEG
jgi:ATP-binding cassette, subfamily B (MDR/TAP), member 7